MEDHSTIESETDVSGMDTSHTLSFYAVTDGVIVPVEEVEDDIFAQKMIGDGFAMRPTSDTVLAPISGRLIEVAQAKHAYYIETKEGVKVLVHVGLDTLLLNGDGFDVKVEKGMKVKKGDPLVTFDAELFKEKGYYTTIPVVILDDQARELGSQLYLSKEAKAGETKALEITF